MAYSSSKVRALSTARMVLPSLTSIFLATQGPMKMTLAEGSFRLIYRPAMIMGEGVSEIRWAWSGKFFST